MSGLLIEWMRIPTDTLRYPAESLPRRMEIVMAATVGANSILMLMVLIWDVQQAYIVVTVQRSHTFGLSCTCSCLGFSLNLFA